MGDGGAQIPDACALAHDAALAELDGGVGGDELGAWVDDGTGGEGDGVRAGQMGGVGESAGGVGVEAGFCGGGSRCGWCWCGVLAGLRLRVGGGAAGSGLGGGGGHGGFLARCGEDVVVWTWLVLF